MRIPRGFRYYVKFVSIPEEFVKAFGECEMTVENPDVMFFVNKEGAEDTLLTIASSSSLRILEQNIDKRFPQMFGSD